MTFISLPLISLSLDNLVHHKLKMRKSEWFPNRDVVFWGFHSSSDKRCWLPWEFISCCSLRCFYDNSNNKKIYTCSPITHCPALIFSSSNVLSVLSAYFTPISTREWQPLVFAWERKIVKGHWIKSSHRSEHSQWKWCLENSFNWKQEGLTMLASASSVVCTCVMLPFSNRSLASKISWGFRPYSLIALVKFVRFSSWNKINSHEFVGKRTTALEYLYFNSSYY